jgi:hypothetical protein
MLSPLGRGPLAQAPCRGFSPDGSDCYRYFRALIFCRPRPYCRCGTAGPPPGERWPWAPLPTRRSIKTVRVRQGVTAAGIEHLSAALVPISFNESPQLTFHLDHSVGANQPAPAPADPSTGYFSFRTYFGGAPTRRAWGATGRSNDNCGRQADHSTCPKWRARSDAPGEKGDRDRARL